MMAAIHPLKIPARSFAASNSPRAMVIVSIAMRLVMRSSAIQNPCHRTRFDPLSLGAFSGTLRWRKVEANEGRGVQVRSGASKQSGRVAVQEPLQSFWLQFETLHGEYVLLDPRDARPRLVRAEEELPRHLLEAGAGPQEVLLRDGS